MIWSEYFKTYLITVPVFFGIDLVWLTLIAKNFYAKHLGYLMSPTPNWVAAGIFYLLNIVGIVIFVVTPGLRDNSLGKTALLGALFGLMTYATYDLTNLATIKNWPLIVTVVDIIWGMVLTSSVSVISFLLVKRFLV
jgi:uncharacterized membrane protein